MGAGPEDPLARMARWDALRRRVGDHSRTPATTAPASAAAPVPSVASTSPLRELAEAARRALDRYPSVAITITVESAGESASVRMARAGDGLAVTVTNSTVDTNATDHGTPDSGTRDNGTPDSGAAGDSAADGSNAGSSNAGGGPVSDGALSDGTRDEGPHGLRERAARIAELLRRDPTLLSGPDRPA